MNREVHVRFWEGLAARFRWATQLSGRARKYDFRPLLSSRTRHERIDGRPGIERKTIAEWPASLE